MKKITILIIALGLTINAHAQKKESKSSFSLSADIVSAFVWRGATASPTPNIQPAMSLTTGNLEIGFWGSTDLLGKFKEIDVFASYSIKGFSVTLTDYFWDPAKKYFDFENKSTGHSFELGMAYGFEKIPLQISAATMLYGDDKKFAYHPTESDSVKCNYSTYIELNYTFSISENDLSVFVAATPTTGFYGNGCALIYAGVTANRIIKITDDFLLPVFATFAVNPQTEDFFVVFGITL